MRIAILVPTRGRPDKLLNLANSACETASGEVEIYAYVDKSDPKKAEYKGLPAQNKHIKIIVGPDTTVAWAVNVLAEKADSDVVMPLGDDTTFKTHTWDSVVAETAAKYPEGLWMCGFNDGRKGFSHVAYDKQWFKALGYWWPPIFNHWAADEWLTKIAQHSTVNRYDYHPDVMVLHEKVGDACPVDDTYSRIRSNTNRDRDHWILKNLQRYWSMDLAAVTSRLTYLKISNTPRIKHYVRTHD